MCHVNLDMKQGAIEEFLGTKFGLPIYYLSDIVGMALGLSAGDLGTDRHFVLGGQN
jgi:heterodisulfide reductase subunit B